MQAHMHTHTLMQGCIACSHYGLTQLPPGTQLCCAGLQTGREVTQRWGSACLTSLRSTHPAK